MTRITQTCFLVLAFTGLLLSCAQETTKSGVSGPPPNSSEQTSPSAPTISFSSVAATSSESNSRIETEVGTSTFPTDYRSRTSGQKSDGAPTEGSEHDALSTEFKSGRTSQSASSGAGETSDSPMESTTGLSFPYLQGLFRAEVRDGKPTPGEVPSENLPNLATDETAADGVARDSAKENNSGSHLDARESTSTVSVSSKTSEEEITTQSTETHFLDNSSKDSGESPVPSKGDAISNPSDVVKNPTPEEVSSTTPSKVQTDDGEWGDNAKSATRKRSLNATHTMTGGTTITSSGLTSSPGVDVSNHAPEAEGTKTHESVADENGDVAQGEQTGVSPTSRPTTEEKSVASSKAMEATKSPYTINSPSESSDVKSTKDDTPESETTPTGSPHDAHLLSISSDALSSFSEESIHSSENTDATAQVSTVAQDRTITIATSWGFRESEDSDPVQNPHSPVPTSSPVTFDPNGMTHNYSQDPDSVTFPSQIFHIDGMPSDAYLNKVDKNLSEEMNQSDPGGTGEVESSEREREEVPAPPGWSVSGERPDAEEEMSNRNTVQSTENPTISSLSTGELHSILSTGTPGLIRNANQGLTDESEEMLNDTPDFQAVQSQSTGPSTTDVSKNGFLIKDLEMNVSNDIGHTTGASSQLSSKGTHELDFSIDYQPDQSEIRPVTVTSPLGTPEPVTVPPGLLNVETRAPLEVTTMSGQPDAVSPDASSPIVLPNPAPSVVNQSTEMASVEVTSGGNVSVTRKEENLANSSIAGVAVKTSVSVSLPLSKPPNVTASSSSGEVTDGEVLSPNITGIILPVPIHVNKDVDGHPAPTVVSTQASTEAPTVSTGLRIRKPKLKIGGGDDTEAPRTRKPFLAPPPKSSSTVGPPVSIFKNARTRIASITSSTTARPFPQFSTIRIHYASRLPEMVPNGELVFSLEPVTTTEATTTETEEPFSEEPFTEVTQAFSMPSEDVVTIVKIAGYVVVDKGLRWNEQLNNRHSPQYKEKSKYVQSQLDRLFRTSGIGSRLWKTEIDGFSGKRKSRSVAIDFFLYIAKSPVEITTDQLRSIFHEKLVNNTFNRFTVDTSKTSFEILDEEPLVSTTEAPEGEPEPVIPQWAIAVIVVGAASLIFIVLFAIVAILGRHHMRRRYSNKLNDEDSERPGDWESKMAAAYENLAADTIYDAEDLHTDTYKK